MTTTPHIIPPASTEIRVLIAICHNLGTVDRRAAQSLIEVCYGNRIERAKAQHGIAAIDLAWYTQAPRVDVLRNVALQQAMQDGFTHVVFLDGDMLFPTDTLERLLRHLPRGAVVSGFYTMRRPPYAPIALREGQPHECGRYHVYRYDDDYETVDAHGLRAEEVVGMGCALIPLDIVAQLGPRPWFHYKDDVEGWPQVSEDVPFCERVRAAGFGIFLDPSIKCGHLFSEVADERFWKRYRESMTATEDLFKGVVSFTPPDGPKTPAFPDAPLIPTHREAEAMDALIDRGHATGGARMATRDLGGGWQRRI